MIDQLLGFFTPWLIAVVVLFLHLVVPARSVTGYVHDETTGEPLKYRLNGVLVFCIAILLWIVLGSLQWVPYTWLWEQRWSGAVGASVLGLLMTFFVVFRGSRWHKSIFVEFWLGRLANPQWLENRVDAKILLYLIGAILLELNLLSFAIHHVTAYVGNPSMGVFLYVLMFSWFIVDYLVFERISSVHI